MAQSRLGGSLLCASRHVLHWHKQWQSLTPDPDGLPADLDTAPAATLRSAGVEASHQPSSSAHTIAPVAAVSPLLPLISHASLEEQCVLQSGAFGSAALALWRSGQAQVKVAVKANKTVNCADADAIKNEKNLLDLLAQVCIDVYTVTLTLKHPVPVTRRRTCLVVCSINTKMSSKCLECAWTTPTATFESSCGTAPEEAWSRTLDVSRLDMVSTVSLPPLVSSP